MGWHGIWGLGWAWVRFDQLRLGVMHDALPPVLLPLSTRSTKCQRFELFGVTFVIGVMKSA